MIRTMTDRPSNECFYLDAEGRKQDAGIHEAILAEGDARPLPELSRQNIIAHATRCGFTDEVRKRLWGF